MGSQKERQERLVILAQLKKVNVEEGMSEALNRKLLEDYMIQMWYLGHQTRISLGVKHVERQVCSVALWTMPGTNNG